MSQRLRRAPKSIPDVGSSSITSLDPPHRAMQTDVLRLLPPESVEETLF